MYVCSEVAAFVAFVTLIRNVCFCFCDSNVCMCVYGAGRVQRGGKGAGGVCVEEDAGGRRRQYEGREVPSCHVLPSVSLRPCIRSL